MVQYIGRDSRGIRHLIMPTTPNSNGDIFYVTKCTRSYYDMIDRLEDGSPTCLWCMSDAQRMTESGAMCAS